MSELEKQMQVLLDRPNNTMVGQQFAEGQNGYDMPKIGSFFKVSDGNVAVIGVGVIMSATIGSVISRFLPSVGKWAPVIAGALLMYFGKSKKILKDLGVGVFLGGLVNVFSGSVSGLLGNFGMSENPPAIMMEDKMTYGGTDGTYPINPDRRVFA